MPHPPRSDGPRAGLMTVASLLLVGLLAAMAWPATAATESDEPELTWAPLVTLPPIAEPAILSPAELADGFALGDSDAPVVVEVWEDFQCPFCQRFTFQIEPLIVEEYVATGRVRLVFRNLAFLGDESHWAAVAAALAADQNRFWPFHDYLFANLQGENVGSFSLERTLAMGEAAGLDMEQFREGLLLENARERFAAIQADAQQDAGPLGINATPTVTVAGVPVPSPDFDTVSAAIDVALGAQGAAGASGDGALERPTPEAAAGDAEQPTASPSVGG